MAIIISVMNANTFTPTVGELSRHRDHRLRHDGDGIGGTNTSLININVTNRPPVANPIPAWIPYGKYDQYLPGTDKMTSSSPRAVH